MVAVTAPTGIGASHIGGLTINTAAGVGVPKVHGEFKRIYGYRAAGGNRQHEFRGVDFRSLEVLVVDEVSMLSGEFFDALDKAVTKMRGESAAKASKEMEEEQSEDDDAEMEDIYLGPGLGSVSVPRRHARRNEGRARVFADSLRDGKKVVALCARACQHWVPMWHRKLLRLCKGELLFGGPLNAR